MEDKRRLLFEAELQRLITRREAYVAENQQRVVTNNSVAYGSDHFFELEQQFENLRREIDAV